MKKEGHQIIFLGGKPTKYQNLGAFERVHYLPLKNDFDVTFNPFMKRKWLKVIDQLKPDVIHAHNPIVGHFLLDTDYPVIYDDHEYWSKQIFKFKERKLPRGIISQSQVYLVPKWEDKLLRRYPVITTTENAAIEHRRKSRWVGVTRNVPMLQQIENLPEAETRQGNVYTGNDFNRPYFLPHRDMSGLRKYIRFDIISGETHRIMMEKLMHYMVGLTPWKPHPWHPFSDANRNYEYMHAGLQVIVNNVMKKIFNTDPFVHAFNNYEEIPSIIENLDETDTSRIMKYANQNYLWENQEDTIRKAYEIAMNL